SESVLTKTTSTASAGAPSRTVPTKTSNIVIIRAEPRTYLRIRASLGHTARDHRLEWRLRRRGGAIFDVKVSVLDGWEPVFGAVELGEDVDAVASHPGQHVLQRHPLLTA